MRDTAPTPDEESFFSALIAQVPDIHDWYHQDDNGTPWMVASLDFLSGGSIHATLRVDYDGHKLRGGWSPACLNWDDGVRAADALIDTAGPDGLSVDSIEPLAAAQAAGDWFIRHRDARPG